MSKFDQNKFKVDDEQSVNAKTNIIKSDPVAKPTIRNFEFQSIKKTNDEHYAATKAKYGPIAVTDAERSTRLQRDRRFSINPLLRDPLSIEQEELRMIEEKVQERVRVVSESAKAIAAEEGYQAGLKQGHEEAFRQFGEQSGDLLRRIEDIVTQMENAKFEMLYANERFIIEMVFRIARSLLLKELSVDREYVLRLAKELVSKVGVRDYLRLKINPADIHLLGVLKESLEKTFGSLQNLTIEASDLVSPGSCSVETDWNSIDANFEKQLNGVYEALIGQTKGETT